MYDREQYLISEVSLKKDLLKLFSVEEELVIFDIGGCEGEDSIRYSRLFPKAKIFIFEPLPKNQVLIEENLINFNSHRVKLIKEALSDIQSIEKFYVSSGRPNEMGKTLNWDFGNKSSSLLPPDKVTDLIPWLKFNDVIEVPTNTIKNFANNEFIKRVDFVHMDVQGAELRVLNGAGDFIKNIKAIWLEVSNDDLYKGQPKTNEVESFMLKNDFRLIKTVFDNTINGDQLYLNRRFFKIFSIFFKKIIIKK